MGRVYVAGSINMDVVATADRHPRIGETVAGKAVLYFPGGKAASHTGSAIITVAQTDNTIVVIPRANDWSTPRAT
jgi:ribokinase